MFHLVVALLLLHYLCLLLLLFLQQFFFPTHAACSVARSLCMQTTCITHCLFTSPFRHNSAQAHQHAYTHSHTYTYISALCSAACRLPVCRQHTNSFIHELEFQLNTSLRRSWRKKSQPAAFCLLAAAFVCLLRLSLPTLST